MSCFTIQSTASQVARLNRGHRRFASPIDEAIRTFMDTDNIEDLTEEEFPMREVWDQATGFDQYFDQMLANLRSLRIIVKGRSRESTQGLNATLIDSAVDEANNGHDCMVSEVRRQHQRDEEHIFIKRGRDSQELKAHLNPIAYRAKKMKLAISSYYPKLLEEAAKKRDKRLAKLDEAKDVMDKHRALITLAQDEIVWNPEFFTCNDRVQGRLWTDGIQNGHIVKVKPGEYNVRLRWTVDGDCARWRPLSVLVDRRRNYYDTPKVEWVAYGPPECGPMQREFPVVVKVKDEFLHDEWAAQSEQRRVAGRREPEERAQRPIRTEEEQLRDDNRELMRALDEAMMAIEEFVRDERLERKKKKREEAERQRRLKVEEEREWKLRLARRRGSI